MAPHNILLFNEPSSSPVPHYRALQSVARSNVLLDEFLKRANRMLLDQSGMTAYSGDCAGSRTTNDRRDIIQLAEDGARDEVLSLALGVTVQLGEWILFASRRRQSMCRSSTTIASAGAGSLSAALAAADVDLERMVRLAPSITAMAWRLGVELNRRARSVEGTDQNWASCQIQSNGVESVAERLRLCNDGLAPHRHAYLGVLTATHATILGPRSSLRKLLNGADATSMRPASPFYAPHLPPLDADWIIGTQEELVASCEWQSNVHSLTNGQRCKATSLTQLLHHAVLEIGSRGPLRYDDMAKSVAAMLRPPEMANVPPEVVILSSSGQLVLDEEQLQDALGEKTQLRVIQLRDYGHGHDDGADDNVAVDDDIAVVAMSGRFPQSDSLAEFWRILVEGINTVQEIPQSRFSLHDWYDGDDANSTERKNGVHTRYGCFLRNPGDFDASLFHISPTEAMQMDPIHRILLMVAYEALEMSGSFGMNGRIATYFGQTTDDWKSIAEQRGIDTHFLPGVNRGFGPGRLHRYLNRHGPFYSIDTGCSSSATAVCLACNELAACNIDAAIVGGGNLLAAPAWYSGLSKGGFLSPTGACKTFADTADGYCRGEAVAVVVLKRLGDAVRAGDNVLAVIPGAARNCNGRSSTSLVAPSSVAQEDVYREALAKARLSPMDVDYVEMHGTGTQAGDRHEMYAVLHALAEGCGATRPVTVGAVKANVGHSEAAAGVVALIKAILMLQHAVIPPQPGWPFTLNRSFPDMNRVRIANRQPWPQRSRKQQRRNILVNCFDAAGGNTSIVVQEPPFYESRQTPHADPRTHHVVVVSGHSSLSCDANRARLKHYLLQCSDISLPSLAYTTTARRIHHRHRRVYVVNSLPQLLDELSSTEKEAHPTVMTTCAANGPIFVFTGQSSQYPGMAAQLYSTNPEFRRLLDLYERICRFHGHPGFLHVLLETSPQKASLTSCDQVALVAMEVALASYLISLNVRPRLVIGHSLGEYAALCIAGVLSVTDALLLVYERALLMEKHCRPFAYRMLSLPLPAAQVKQCCDTHGIRDWEIACYNGPSATVISAPADSIAALEERMTSEGIRGTRLNVEYGFHSSQMDPLLAPFERLATMYQPFQAPTIPVASTVLGRVISPRDQVFDASYLTRHMRQPVNLDAAVRAAESNRHITTDSVAIEIGPHPTCLSLMAAILEDVQPPSLPTLRKACDDWRGLSQCLAGVHQAGLTVDWAEFHQPYLNNLRLLASLPSYAFDLKTFWEPYKSPAVAVSSMACETSVKASPFVTLTWTCLHEVQSLREESGLTVGLFTSDVLRRDLREAIQGHVVDAHAICPASVFIDMAYCAAGFLVHGANDRLQTCGAELRVLEISAPLILQPLKQHQAVHVEATLDQSTQVVSVRIADPPDGPSNTTYATCRLSVGSQRSNATVDWSRVQNLVQSRAHTIASMPGSQACNLDRTLFYHIFSDTVVYNDAYKSICETKIPTDFLDAVAIMCSSDAASTRRFACDAFLVDGAIHLAGFLLNANPSKDRSHIHICNSIERLVIAEDMVSNTQYRAFAAIREQESQLVRFCDVYVFNADHKLMIAGLGIRFQRLDRNTFSRKLSQRQLAKDIGNNLSRTRAPLPQPESLTSLHSAGAPDRSGLTQRALGAGARVEHVLLATIADTCGFTIQELESSKPIDELGLDSQMCITIMAKVSKATAIELPASLLAGSPTVADLIVAVRSFSEDEDGRSLGTHEKLLLIDDGDPVSATGHVRPSWVVSSPHKTASQVLFDLVDVILGTKLGHIDARTTWSSLGLGSMHSIRIISRFQEDTGIELPLSFFLDHPSVRDVEKELEWNAATASTMPSSTIATTASACHLSTVDDLETTDLPAPTSRAILLQGSPRSREPPLFLLTDGSGTVEAYMHFPTLPSGRRTYGLESPFVNNPGDFTISLTQVCKIFKATIQHIQPRGPYSLGGWSIGGHYAYEVARQLSLDGEEINLLLIMDTRAPRPAHLKTNLGGNIIDALCLDLCNARGGHVSATFTQRERDHLTASFRMLVNSQDLPFTYYQQKPKLTAIIWATRGLNEDMNTALHDPTVTRKAAMSHSGSEEDEIKERGLPALREIFKSWFFGRRRDSGLNGWDHWLGQGRLETSQHLSGGGHIAVESVEGNHFSIVAPPDVFGLAKLVSHFVKDATLLV